MHMYIFFKYDTAERERVDQKLATMVARGIEVGVGRCFAVVLARCRGRESCLSIASDGTDVFAGAAGYSPL